MNIPFRVKLLTKTAKAPHRNCESDLWDLYADGFCAENLKDIKYDDYNPLYSYKGKEIPKRSFYNEQVRVNNLVADREIYLRHLIFEKINHDEDHDGNIILYPQGRILVRTGVKLELPIQCKGHQEWFYNSTTEFSKNTDTTITQYAVADIRPRSDALEQKGLFIENKTITGGEVSFVAINHGHEPITINKGDVIAKMLICSVYPSKMEVVDI